MKRSGIKNMRSNWSATTDGLIYSGMDFIAYVTPSIKPQSYGCVKLNQIMWNVYFNKGMGSEDRRQSKVSQFTNCEHAVDYVEKFFELSISEQREQFNMWCKEVKL